MASLRPSLNETTRHSFTALLAAPAHAAARITRVRIAKPISLSTMLVGSALLLGGMAAGLLLSTQWQTRTSIYAGATSPVTRQSDREIVAATISRLETDQANLKNQIADLRTQLNSVQGNDSIRKTTLRDINNDISSQRLASGMVPVAGQGVIATFDDSTAHTIPENEDPANYILHEYDLRDMLNSLWIAGAEAVSINGERIVSNTSLYCVGTTIICNATRLSPPYIINAIGDPQVLTAALRGSSQMEKFNQRASIYDLPVSIEPSQNVLVPAYNGSFVFKYAKVQGQH